MTNKKDELAELKARVAELERAKAAPAPPPPYDPVEAERATRKWVDEMNRLREARANIVPDWLVRETAGGVSDSDAKGIAAARHAPTGPSSAGVIPSSQQMSNVRGTVGVPGGGTGWAHDIPTSPNERWSMREWLDPKAREQGKR